MSIEKTVELPVRILKKFLEAEEELEQWLMAHDRDFIETMRKARQDHLNGKAIPWEKAKKQLDIE